MDHPHAPAPVVSKRTTTAMMPRSRDSQAFFSGRRSTVRNRGISGIGARYFTCSRYRTIGVSKTEPVFIGAHAIARGDAGQYRGIDAGPTLPHPARLSVRAASLIRRFQQIPEKLQRVHDQFEKRLPVDLPAAKRTLELVSLEPLE